uniref:PAS domain-containing protein n=1 Tax=Aureoumbra lagunensis TaxID=44058 RepID=A0A7S3JXV4_9STRA|mmetsp:Transcript_587/g.726  ORF Transcript_587/g.726 Transcript_587/m.726 type:complete len:1101 (-) Transcript_587:1012-4314(-)|eukprot:CAMPEP_0197285226 /NCGR_PEP_ID=MMETSP0890-20130614/455_1 /TAXON_ID=44058 ORGANISM="Aureoumbra lagunensis, Strain CCMP1510" /NCGR_SAMPLE_ID=MMETSP0890 /ASSEMBLY_ACC=CAM_ASM_000533 /LENGTH=1100 /DNA_ID=CAMNT_0042752531 /DNA_START=62 /DNA_END=3364 /DNA_ORIENTATION=+
MEIEEELTVGRRTHRDDKREREGVSLLSPKLGGNLGGGGNGRSQSGQSGGSLGGGILGRPRNTRLTSMDWMGDVDLSQGLDSNVFDTNELENFQTRDKTGGVSQRWWDVMNEQASNTVEFWQDEILPEDELMDLGPMGQLGTRRAYADMAADERQNESTDDRHVDSKPRLGGSSSDECEKVRGRNGNDSLSSDDHQERRRDTSPLSRALKFLYSAASPKITDNVGGNSLDLAEQEKTDKIMSDTSIWQMTGLDTDTSSSPENPFMAQMPPRLSSTRIINTHHSTQRRNRRHRTEYTYADDDELECYSDVENEKKNSFQPITKSIHEIPLDPAQPLTSYKIHWSADAKRPAYEGDEIKRIQEAKEIAVIDTLHRHEAKLEAKQDAPEYEYSLTPHTRPIIGTPDVKNSSQNDDLIFSAGRAVTTLPPGVTSSECLPTPDHDHSFFTPYVVVYRPYDDTDQHNHSQRSIVRCGASFCLEELSFSKGRETQEERIQTERRAQVEAKLCDKKIEALRRSTPRGTVILGGGDSKSSALMPVGEAARLIAFHDDPEGDSSAEEQEKAAKNDLQELIAQKVARKPPRRCARPLAPAGVELSQNERIALERERNREHARNTRLRKKAALINLKDTVEKLTAKCQQADQNELERRARGSVKRACIEAFFRFRARAEADPERWAQVVTHDIELWQPITPHQSYRPAESSFDKSRRLSKGVNAIIEDASSLAVLFRSIGRCGAAAAKFDRAPRFVFEATIASRDQSESAITDAFIASDTIAMHWCMRTLDALDFGVDREVAKNGMLIAKFDKMNCKIKSIEFMYDVQAFATQIQRALRLAAPPIVPNLYFDENLDSHDDPRVVTSATRPHVIENCNTAWMDMCGIQRKEDVVGHTLRCIQGDLTDEERVSELHYHIANGRAADALLVNYRLSGEPFLNYLRVFPLFSNDALDDPRIPPTHYLGVLRDTLNIDDERRRYHQQQQQQRSPHGVIHHDPEWNAAIAAAVIASTPTGIAAQRKLEKRHQQHYHRPAQQLVETQQPRVDQQQPHIFTGTRSLDYNTIPTAFPDQQQRPVDVVPQYPEYGQPIPPQYTDPRVWGNYQPPPPGPSRVD